MPNIRCKVQYSKKIGDRIYTAGEEWDLVKDDNVEVSMQAAFEFLRSNVNFYRDRDLVLDIEEDPENEM